MYFQVLEHLLTYTASSKRFQYPFCWFIVTVWGCWCNGYLSDHLLPTSFHYLCKLTFWLSGFIQSDNNLKTKDQELQQPLWACSQLLFVPSSLIDSLMQFLNSISEFTGRFLIFLYFSYPNRMLPQLGSLRILWIALLTRCWSQARYSCEPSS